MDDVSPCKGCQNLTGDADRVCWRCRKRASERLWDGGDVPEDGMVLVDAAKLRDMESERLDLCNEIDEYADDLNEAETKIDMLTLERDRWEERCNEARKLIAELRAEAPSDQSAVIDPDIVLTECWCDGADVGHNLTMACSEMTEEERARAAAASRIEIQEPLPPIGQGRLDQAIDALVETLPPDIMDTKFSERCYRGDPCTVCQAEPTVRDIISATPAWGRCEGCCEEVCPKHQHTADGATWCSYCAEATTDDASPRAEAP